MNMANMNNDGNESGENIDESAPTIIDFLDASVMTLNKHLSEQERHQAADERAPFHEHSTAVLGRATALDITDRALACLPATHSRLAAKAKHAGTN